MNRESICKQQIHCLSCPLSVRITGKDCRTLTHKELINLIVPEFENTCIYCGAVIPEGHTVCPNCLKTEAEHFEKAMSRKLEQPEFKPDDAIAQAYKQGMAEGMKHACEIKQENEQLKRRIVILENQANKVVYDTDGCYE